MFCYLITNTINGKKYVGITTKTIRGRWMQHCRGAKYGRKSALYAAIRKYGKQSFLVEEICGASCWDELIFIEKKEIAERGTRKPAGYNLTQGGDGTLGVVKSDEARARMSEFHMGKPKSETHRAAMRKPKTPEHRAKIAAAHLGRKRSPEARLAMSAAAMGRAPSPQAIAASAARHRGCKKSAETRRRMSSAQTGRVMSPETRAKLSAAATLRHATRGVSNEHKRDSSPNP